MREKLFRLSLQTLLLFQTNCQLTPKSANSEISTDETPYTITINSYNSFKIETFNNKYSQYSLTDGINLLKEHCGFVYPRRTRIDQTREFASVIVFVIQDTSCYPRTN